MQTEDDKISDISGNYQVSNNLIELAMLLPKGRILFGDNSFTFFVYSLNNFELISQFQTKANKILSYKDLLITNFVSFGLSEKDKVFNIWSVDTGELTLSIVGHNHAVKGFLISPDGKLISWSRDKTIRIWSIETGECLGILQGHTDTIWNTYLLKGNRILTMGGGYEDSIDWTVKIWSLENLSCLHSAEMPIFLGAIPLQDERILTWSIDSSIRIWSRDLGHQLSSISIGMGKLEKVHVLPSGNILIRTRLSGLQGRKLTAFSEKTGILLASIGLNTEDKIVNMPNGKLLIIRENEISIWDPESDELNIIYTLHKETILGAVIDENRNVVSWDKGGSIHSWRADDAKQKRIHNENMEIVKGIIFLEKDKFLAWYEKGFVKIFEVE